MIEVKNVGEYLDMEANELLTNGLTLIKFYSVTCAPCKMLSKEISKLVETSNIEANLLEVDVEVCPELASEFEVFSVPTLIFLKDKVEYDRIIGFAPHRKIEDILNK